MREARSTQINWLDLALFHPDVKRLLAAAELAYLCEDYAAMDELIAQTESLNDDIYRVLEESYA